MSRSTGDSPAATGVVIDRTPDCIVRNHDADRSYDLTVTARDADGAVVLERDLSVDPDDTVEWTGALVPGRYEVRAETATGPEDAAVCDVAADPASTVLVELGNWQVSVTNGF
jgi:hypothetical protein